MIDIDGQVKATSRNYPTWAACLLSLCVLLFAIQGVYPNTARSQQPGGQFFPQTGYYVGERFYSYWLEHGGLTQQGYPISNAFQEVSSTDGKTYTVQYFERAVFELHPEHAGTAHEVLLSLLGVQRYQDLYGPSGAANQRASTDNPRLFPQTGYTVGGLFRTYWEQHGGLAQQGYPVSNEFEEISALDGRTYLVQYFERAVFELHPENAGSPFEVLLTQLGSLQHRARYSTLTIPGPSAPGLFQTQPRGSEAYLLWNEVNIKDDYPHYFPRQVLMATFALNIHTGKVITVTSAPNITIRNASISGSTVVGLGPPKGTNCSICDADIVSLDLNTGVRSTLVAATGIVYKYSPVISGKYVAWIEGGDEVQRIVLLDIETGASRIIPTVSGTSPDNVTSVGPLFISTHYLVWNVSSFANGVSTDIVMTYKLSTGQLEAVVRTSSRAENSPYIATSGRYLVWTDPYPHLLDLETYQAKVLDEERVLWPVMRGDSLLWIGKDYVARGMKLSSGTVLPLASPSSVSYVPALVGDWLVWEDRTAHLKAVSLWQAFSAPKAPTPTPAPSPQPAGARLVADNLHRAPVDAGKYLFWLGLGSNNRLYGYSSDKGKRVMVGEDRAQKLALASDGKDLVWIERLVNGLYQIRHLDLQTSQLSTVVRGSSDSETYGAARSNVGDHFPPTLAVDAGILYYQSTAAEGMGLRSRVLATGQEQLISRIGRYPVASSGYLLWLDQLEFPGSYSIEYNVHLRVIGNPGEYTLLLSLSQGDGPPSRYGVSGDYAVWGAHNRGIYLYDIRNRTSTLLAMDRRNPISEVSNPIIRAGRVVWMEATEMPNYIVNRQLISYNIATGTRSSVLQFAPRANIGFYGILDGQLLAYMAEDKVYLVDLP
ncbi:MAG: hypothetical protein M3437_19925 [Chloroflexota bacterium]|nr:hypothetical protein [Chloroflexota bacterium]MDQ5866021.1 hypothetical protein [Chloroflexota bacterium]